METVLFLSMKHKKFYFLNFVNEIKELGHYFKHCLRCSKEKSHTGLDAPKA